MTEQLKPLIDAFAKAEREYGRALTPLEMAMVSEEYYCAPQSVAVKPLRWEKAPRHLDANWVCDVGLYQIANNVLFIGHSEEGEQYGSDVEAKAAAQADHERRILSQITTEPVAVQEAARVLLDDFDKIETLTAPDVNWRGVYHAMIKDYHECGWADWPSILDAALRAIAGEGE